MERLRFLTGFPFEVFGLRSGERLPGLPCGGVGRANCRHPELDALLPYGDERLRFLTRASRSELLSLRSGEKLPGLSSGSFARRANRRHREPDTLPSYGDGKAAISDGFSLRGFQPAQRRKTAGIAVRGVWEAQAADFGSGYFPAQLLNDLRSRSAARCQAFRQPCAAQHSPDAKPAYSCMKNSACMSVRSVTAFPWKATAMRSCARCISTTWQ